MEGGVGSVKTEGMEEGTERDERIRMEGEVKWIEGLGMEGEVWWRK